MALEDERDLLASILADLGNFVESVWHLITDQAYSTEAIGFPVNQNFVPNIAGIGDALQAAAAGKADLPQYAAAAEKLAGLSEAVRLAVQAAQADLPVGMAVEEAVETLLDTVGLAYLTARHPWLMFLARAANLLVERLPEETVAGLEVAGRVLLGGLIFAIEPFGAIKLGWDALSNTETDDDARQHSPALAVLGLLLALTPFFVQSFGHRTIAPDTFVVLHGWESEQTGDEVPLGDKISQRFVTIVLRLSGTSTDAGTGQPVDGKAEIAVTLALVPREHLGPGLWISLGIGAEADIHLGGGWHFVIEGELDDGIDMLLPGSTAPDGAGFVRSGGASGGTGEVRFEHRDEGGTPGLPATPWRLGGVLEAKTVELGLKFGDRAPNMSLTLKVREAALIAPQPDHGFFHDVLPSGLRLNFDLGVVLDATPRLYLDGGSGGSVLIPIRTGTPKLQGLHVYLELRSRPDDQTTGPPLTFEVSGGFATKLGGFTATVDRFGVMLPEAPHPLPGAKWLKLPNAIGIGIASGKDISGGGFVEFEPDRGRYEGVLTLTLGRYTITRFRPDQRYPRRLFAADRRVAGDQPTVARAVQHRGGRSGRHHRAQPFGQCPRATERFAHRRCQHNSVPERPDRSGTAGADHVGQRLPCHSRQLDVRNRLEAQLVRWPGVAVGRRDHRDGTDAAHRDPGGPQRCGTRRASAHHSARDRCLRRHRHHSAVGGIRWLPGEFEDRPVRVDGRRRVPVPRR